MLKENERIAVFASLMLMLFAGCAKMRSDTVTGQYTSQQLFQQDTAGVWRTHCYPQSGLYAQSTFYNDVANATYTLNQSSWDDSTCSTTPHGLLTSVFSYATTVAPGSGVRIYTIAATILSGESVFYAPIGVTAANTLHICGYTNWVNGVAKSWFLPGENCVSTLGFSQQPEAGMISYTRAKVDSTVSPSVLTLGNDPFPNTNPNSLSPNFSLQPFYYVSP